MLQIEKYSHISQKTLEKISEYIELSPYAQIELSNVEKFLNDPAIAKNPKLADDQFLKRLEFGTAGLRGKMGTGYNSMNDLIVIQTSQGLAMYWLTLYGVYDCQKYGVVVGFDGRHYSKQYAHEVAAVFLSKGYKVYLSSQYTATPMIPFAITKYKCVGGVQITASHNPKQDNGYKVYAKNGAQIIPPMDQDISNHILSNLKPWVQMLKLIDSTTGLLNYNTVRQQHQTFLSKKNTQQQMYGQMNSYELIDPYKDLYSSYPSTIMKEIAFDTEMISKSSVKIVYTALHGVGSVFVEHFLKSIRFDMEKFYSVTEQRYPDPEFPTVKFPNPEEAGALDLAMKLADSKDVKIVIANDPDADRFACAEKQPETGTWKVFKGDELGFIFAARMLEKFKKQGHRPEELLFLCSAVSSRMLGKFCEHEGCQYAETATGFKWIMNKALEKQTEIDTCNIFKKFTDIEPKKSQNEPKKKCKFCFSYEEALGYACTLSVPDKDGISASAVWVELVCDLYRKNSTVTQYLENLSSIYGYSVTNNSYFLCYEPEIVREIFFQFRNEGKYSDSIGRFKLNRIRDVSMRYDSGEEDQVCQLPYTAGAEMITLYFALGVTITFRTSGTEPKLKWYAELVSRDKNAHTILQEILDETIEHFLKFKQYKDHLHKP